MLQPKRALDHSPLFQVMLALQEDPGADLELTGIRSSRLPVATDQAQFDLTLALVTEGTRIVARWEYRRDLFDATTIMRLSRYFEAILAAVVGDPRQCLSRLPLLSPAQAHQLLWEEPATSDVLILDRDLKPVPLGAAGELHQRTAMEREGLGSPADTARRFVPDPFSVTPGSRLERTGERVRRHANGRLDSLPTAAGTPAESPTRRRSKGAARKAPQSATEKLVAGLWEEVLGRDGIDASDDFFDLGGHSLLASRVLAQLYRRSGVDLPLPAIFEAPTVAELAALLERQRQRQGPATAIAPAQRSGAPPLSFAQERLWFLDRWDPGSSTLNIPAFVALDGDLEPAVIARALNEVVQRHEVLRTTFEEADGRPVQIVHPTPRLDLAEIDLRHLTAGAGTREARRLAQSETSLGFDLAHGPLLRMRLIRLTERSYHLLLTLHHIVSDGWSISILIRELVALYRAEIEDQAPGLPELPVQYVDFATWQRRSLDDQLDDQVDYWRQQLAGDLPGPPLPTDRRRPAVQTYRGRRSPLRLTADLSERLRRLGSDRGATLFMVLLAAFKILLRRLSAERDILVGTPIAGRDREETQGLVGCFLNTLVLRTDLSRDDDTGPEPSFDQVLTRLRKVTVDAFAHQDVPFEKLLAELMPERDTSRTPLFQVLFNMLNFPAEKIRLPGLTAEYLPAPEIGSKFDLTLYVEDRNEIQVDFVYNADLFDAARIEELGRQYLQLLEQIEESPDAPLDRYSLVTPIARGVLPDPRQHLGGEWCGAVHEGFLRQASRRPDHPAVVDRDVSWSYRELEVRSRELAAELTADGIRQEDVVAIYAHRSAPLVAAILGILRSGAAFCVLDPTYPPPRLIEQLRLLRPRGWVRVAAAGPPADEIERFLDTLSLRCRQTLGNDSTTAATSLAPPPVGATHPDRLACVTFTSGATGVPKGILGRHGGLSSFLPWRGERFGLDGSDRHAMLSGLAHDPLQRDIFTPLWFGATLVIPDPEAMWAPGWLIDWLRRQEVTVVNLTPALGQVLGTSADAEPELQLPAWRNAFFVGETLNRRDVARLERLAPNLVCVNLYGCTETQRALSYHVVASRPEVTGKAIPANEAVSLGRGMPGAQLLVLGLGGRLAGVGELGEIHIRSPQVARGYLDAGATAARFLPNPYSRAGDDRMYRTGDLGRYRSDGEVVFVGRNNQQVQIRGFRVEPAEIEGELNRHPAVRQSAVVARDDAPSGRGLVAYLVRANANAVDWRAYLGRQLPPYMVPAAFVDIDAMPLTATGKIDRRSLPAPHSDRAGSRDGSRDQIEEMLADVWADVLGIEDVGIHDGFFDLGGHSLLATQVLSRVRESFAVDLPLRSLFEIPTVAGLAELVRQELATEVVDRPEPIAPVPRGDGLPLSFAQRRLWFVDQLDPGNVAYNISTPLRLEGRLDVAALEQSFRELARRHETLRTVFREVSGRPRQIITPYRPGPLPLIDLTSLPEAQRSEQVREQQRAQWAQPFDFERGPLWRLLLLRLAHREHVLLMTMHHIVTDRWSTGILTRELIALYQAYTAGERPGLPALPVQYADYAVWQRRTLSDQVLEDLLDHWRRHLAGVGNELYLPPDLPAKDSAKRRAAVYTFDLDADATEALRQTSRSTGATLFMVALAAFSVLLRHRSGADVIAVGTDIANRNRRETEGLIGFFVNQLVLRVDLEDELVFRDLVARVREASLEAYARQDLPFDRLVEALRPQRDTESWSPFQVKINVHNVPMTPPELPELRVHPLDGGIERPPQLALIVNLVEIGERLSISLEYDSNLYSELMVLGFGEQYRQLLKLVARPETMVNELTENLVRIDRQRALDARAKLKRVRSKRFRRSSRNPYA